MPRLSRPVRRLAAALAWPLLVLAGAVWGEEKPATDWSALVGVAIEYDSNVAVEELDATTNQGDYAMTLDGGLAVKQQLSETAEAARISAERKLHQDRQDVAAPMDADVEPLDQSTPAYDPR